LRLLSKFFLNRPDIALKTYIIVPKDRVEDLTEDFVRRGLLEPLPPQEAGKALETIRKRIELAERALTLFKRLSSLVRKSIEIEIKELPWDTDKALEKLINEFEEISEIVERLVEDAERVKSELEKLKALRFVISELSKNIGLLDKSLINYEGEYLISKTLYGNVREVEEVMSKSLKVLFYRVLGEEKAVAVVVLDKRAYENVEPLVKKLEVPVTDTSDFIELSNVDKSIREIETRLTSIESRLEDLLESRLYELALLKVLAETVHCELGVLDKALSSKYMAVIVGRSLRSRRNELKKLVRAASGYVVFEEEINPPVELNNLKPFKPFEIFTEIMGYPSPQEWDPTPLITYFYLIFFALMFPDIGYSIGLIIGARLVLPYFIESKETLKKLINIATYTGIAGCVTGLLTNSFFGSLLGSYVGLVVPKLLPSLPARLADPEATGSAIISYIALTLLLGYYVIIIAHILGAIKKAIIGDKPGFILEVLIILIAILGPSAIHAAFNLNTDIWGLLKLVDRGIILYITIVIMMLYATLKSLLDKPFGVMLWLFDVLGILADVLSFVRIAGLALGSAILAELINNLVLNLIPTLSSMSFILGLLGGIAISLLLHIVNIGLSSLSPFVHSLRLVMYELSSKFYEGSGRKISPLFISLLKVKIGSTT
jgi:V/A-type H+-transporting ATPase subunit I